MRRRPAAVLIGLLAWVLAGCSMAGAGTTPAAQNGSDANQTDVSFSQQMIPHHRQSLQLAKLVAKRSSSEFVKDTAAEITTAETAEIEVMSGWLKSWSIEVPADSQAVHSMPGMLSAAEISVLEKASGQAFDKQWLATMLKHLNSGVQMATTALETGQHPPTKTLAQQIITEQTARITAIDGNISKPK